METFGNATERAKKKQAENENQLALNDRLAMSRRRTAAAPTPGAFGTDHAAMQRRRAFEMETFGNATERAKKIQAEDENQLVLNDRLAMSRRRTAAAPTPGVFGTDRTGMDRSRQTTALKTTAARGVFGMYTDTDGLAAFGNNVGSANNAGNTVDSPNLKRRAVSNLKEAPKAKRAALQPNGTKVVFHVQKNRPPQIVSALANMAGGRMAVTSTHLLFINQDGALCARAIGLDTTDATDGTELIVSLPAGAGEIESLRSFGANAFATTDKGLVFQLQTDDQAPAGVRATGFDTGLPNIQSVVPGGTFCIALNGMDPQLLGTHNIDVGVVGSGCFLHVSALFYSYRHRKQKAPVHVPLGRRTGTPSA